MVRSKSNVINKLIKYKYIIFISKLLACVPRNFGYTSPLIKSSKVFVNKNATKKDFISPPKKNNQVDWGLIPNLP